MTQLYAFLLRRTVFNDSELVSLKNSVNFDPKKLHVRARYYKQLVFKRIQDRMVLECAINV